MVKVSAKATAIAMRQAGHSYNYIAPKVGVSKGTLSVWLANIPYSPNKETLERIGRALAASGAAKSKLKQDSLRKAHVKALADIGELSRRDLFMIGLGLYIGEGAKSINQTVFVNANPTIVRFMVKWFTEALGLQIENLRARIHTYPDCDVNEGLRFWSQTTQIPRDQFLKSIIDTRPNKKIKKNGKLPHGTIHLSVNSLGEARFGVFLARRIMACMDIVLENNAGLV